MLATICPVYYSRVLQMPLGRNNPVLQHPGLPGGLCFPQVFRSKLGIELNMPVIAAECCPRKREYLLKRGLEYRHVFADMAELLEPTAYDYVCGKKVAVPRPDMVLGGFSCKDVSRIKRSRPSFDSDASTSGLTFRLLLQLVGLWRPKWVLLENVLGLADHGALDTV